MTNQNQWLAALFHCHEHSTVNGLSLEIWKIKRKSNKHQIYCYSPVVVSGWCNALSISPLLLVIGPHSSLACTGLTVNIQFCTTTRTSDTGPASYSPCAGSCFYAGQPWDVSMFRGFMRKTSFISHFAQCQCLQSQVGSKSMRWVRCLWDHLFQTELNLNLWYENGQKFRPNIDTPCRHRLCGSPHAAHRHAEHSSYFPTRRQIFSRYIFKYFSIRLQLYSRYQDRGLRGYMAVITAPGLPTKLDNNFVQPCIWRLQPVIKTAPRSPQSKSCRYIIEVSENWALTHL